MQLYLPCFSDRIFMKLTEAIYLIKPLHHIRFQVKRWKVRVMRVVHVLCCVHSVAPCLLDGFASHIAQIKHTKQRRVTHHFLVKKLRWMSHRSFNIKALWLLVSWTDVAKIQPMRGRCVAHHFQVKGQRSSESFKIFAASVPLLSAYLAYSFYI